MRALERNERRERRRLRETERAARLEAAVRLEKERLAFQIAAQTEELAERLRTEQLRVAAMQATVKSARIRTVDLNIAIESRRARQLELLQQRHDLMARLQWHQARPTMTP
jgi:hypothetical protein